MDSAELSARITLRALPGLKDCGINNLVAEYGSASDALRSPHHLLQAGAKTLPDTPIRKRVASAMRTIDRLGIQVLASESPEYPRRLVERLEDSRPALFFTLGDTRIIDHA